MTSAPAVVRRLYRQFAHLIHELAKFGAVGAASMVVDVGANNLLHVGLGVGPLTSKTLSVAAATTLAYAGNRYWTFRHRDRTGLAREYFLFWVLNGIGLLISLLCVGFTYYTLKLTGPLAYNISANVVGLILGTAFRYWSYKKWVFLPPTDPPVDPHTGLPEPPDDTHTGAGVVSRGGRRTSGGAGSGARRREAGARELGDHPAAPRRRPHFLTTTDAPNEPATAPRALPAEGTGLPGRLP